MLWQEELLLDFATTVVEEYDGSSWTSNPNGIPTAARSMMGAGTQTAAVHFRRWKHSRRIILTGKLLMELHWTSGGSFKYSQKNGMGRELKQQR